MNAGSVIGRCREFTHRREGMCHALDGGIWLHRHTLKGERMAHVVSADRDLLLALGGALGLDPSRLQDKPLKDPRTGRRVPAWHWDLVGRRLQQLDERRAGDAAAPRADG